MTVLWQARVGLQHADHIFCLNFEDRDYLINRLRCPPSRITRIYPAANPLYAQAAQRRDYTRCTRLLFAGTWIARKGTVELAQAFTRLAQLHPALKLVVLGGGVPTETMQAAFPVALRSRVECVNTATEAENAAAFAAADIYLLPSRFEGTPLTLIEAMMSGLPIVTTATCGMKDVIRDGENGLLIPVRSPDAIVETVEWLLSDSNCRAKLGRNAQAEALRQYTWEQAAAPVREVYERLCLSTGA
jgi:glycosyltransferase involved in cell wall biosynthesis